MYQETNPNHNEIFPLKGKLGAPGGFAKAKKLAALVASLATVAATVLFFALSVVCTAQSIFPTRAQIEVRLENWDEKPVSWDLTVLQQTTVLQTGLLSQKVSILKLEGLTPDTWYELRFYEQADADHNSAVGSYRFRTGKEAQPTGTQPTGTRPTGTQPTGTQPTGTQPTGTQSTGTQPTGTQPTEPKLVEPSAQAPVLESYTPPTEDGSGYWICFSFQLNDGLPEQILVTDSVTSYQNFFLNGGNQGPEAEEKTTVTRAYTLADIVVDTAANTATITFFAEDPYKGHSVTAVLEYALYDDRGNVAGTGSVSSDACSLVPSFLYGMEVSPNTTWSAVVHADTIDVELIMKDFHSGTLDFALNELNIYVDYESADAENYVFYELAQLITVPPLPVPEDGVIRYRFTIPRNPEGWQESPIAIHISMDASGDCILDGEPMGLHSGTFAYTTVYTVETYSAQAPSLDLPQELLAELKDTLGLELEYVEIVSGGTGAWGSSLENLLPGTQVYVYISFSGTVLADGALTPGVTWADDLAVTELEPCPVYAGDQGAVLSFAFTVPERDVDSTDIVIHYFSIEMTEP